jgi:hypothetical protein
MEDSTPSEPSTEVEPSNNQEPTQEPTQEPSIEESARSSLEYLNPEADLQLVFHEQSLVEDADIWNYLAPDQEGFFFTTMFDDQLMLRSYDFSFQPILLPIPVASSSDLTNPNTTIADHAMIRSNERLFFVITTPNYFNAYLISSDLEGNRINRIEIQENELRRTNDPHLFTVEDNICVRWGESGYEKAYRCFDTDLNPLSPIQIQTTSIPTVQLGGTVWTGEKFIVFSGDETQTDMIISQFDEEWNELEPFQQVIIPSQYEEWNWASTGVAWIPEHELWAVAYTNMPSDGGDMDGRVRIALFDKEFTLLSINFAQKQDSASFRPHLLWHENQLILSYDAGPVLIERWGIENF